VRSPDAQVTGSGVKYCWFLLENDFYLINWTRTNFETPKQINK